LDSLVDRGENIIIILTLANGAIAGWLAAQQPATLKDNPDRALVILLASWLPLVLSLFGFLWFRSLRLGQQRIARYLVKLEERLAFPDLGWERQWRGSKSGKAVRMYSVVTLAYATLLALSVLFGLVSTLQIVGGSIKQLI
jgi:hypothetical protein